MEAAKLLNFKGQINIIGDLDQIKAYREKIHKLSKNMNVVFHGLIKDKTRLFSIIKSSNLFIFPSEIETMSMMLLEVASQNVAIIASDIIENTSVFDNDEILLFESKNVLSLSKKIRFALNHPKQMHMQASKAFIKTNTMYNWDTISHQYDKIYKHLFSVSQ